MTFDFTERLNYSQGIAIGPEIERHLVRSIPLAVAFHKNTTTGNDHGIDGWIERNGLPPVSVDFKHESYCPILRWGQHKDEACIETVSVWRDGKEIAPGWTVNPNKRTDLVVYTWPTASEARRFWILWFPFLCQAAIRNRAEWEYRFRVHHIRNRDYETLCMYPPRRVIAQAMKALTSGAA